ncbi:MAG: hypothetical protein R3211_01620 [Balneolaceae bacterium]|nr:hypothetical protein [Balneolaceae bacterium]
MHILKLLITALLFVSCTQRTPENLEQRIDQLISQDQYEQALELLEDADPATTDSDLETLKEKIHLNYGLYLEYRGPEGSTMRDRMTSALQQYIAVLKINPQNEKARAEINQIMSVYNTMPDRSPPDEILEELKELGIGS